MLGQETLTPRPLWNVQAHQYTRYFHSLDCFKRRDNLSFDVGAIWGQSLKIKQFKQLLQSSCDMNVHKERTRNSRY